MVYNIQILILEDRVSDADLIEYKLQEAGIPFTSQRVMTENDYVRALREFSPDLILSDYDLPQYTGALALVTAKKLCPEVPFILVTGILSKSDGRITEILSAGASDCVLKDDLDQLAPIVGKALGIRS